MSRRRAPGRDRTHVTPGRPRAVLLRYTDDEYAEVADAAQCAGLTPSGYAADAALAAAKGHDAPALHPERAALTELIRARGQVRRLGVNVNQAARQLNAFGEAPRWLEEAVTAATRAVVELEATAAAMTTATRRRSAAGQGTPGREAAMATSRPRTTAVRQRSHGQTARAARPPAMTGHPASHPDTTVSSGWLEGDVAVAIPTMATDAGDEA